MISIEDYRGFDSPSWISIYETAITARIADKSPARPTQFLWEVAACQRAFCWHTNPRTRRGEFLKRSTVTETTGAIG